jgi:hypothetical protein
MKKEKVKNYLPHAGIETIDRVSEEQEYMICLSRVVGRACDKWLEAKGLKNGFKHDFTFGNTLPKQKQKKNYEITCAKSDMKSPAQNAG